MPMYSRSSSSSLHSLSSLVISLSFLSAGTPLTADAAHDDDASSPIARPMACTKSPFKEYKFCDRSLPLDERVEDLVDRIFSLYPPTGDSDVISNLLTAQGYPAGNLTSLESALGVPATFWGSECIHGVQSTCIGSQCPTSFPSPSAIGATWDVDRNVESMGSIMAKEARALWQAGARSESWYGSVLIGLGCWSPTLNLARDPRWGRNQEVPSEDPRINAGYGAAYTRAMQGTPPPPSQNSDGDIDLNDNFPLITVTAPKHFFAYNFEGTSPYAPLNRFNFDAIVPEYDLYDSYLPVFRRAIVESKAGGLMCSYNEVNGIPSCAHPLMKSLREKWNFTGYITSDCGAVTDFLPNEHNYSQTGEEAVCAALNATMNVECYNADAGGGVGMFDKYMASALREGECRDDVVKESLRVALKIEFRLGLYDPPTTAESSSSSSSVSSSSYPYWNWASMADVATDASKSENQRIADASMTLLKNSDRTLPIHTHTAGTDKKKAKVAMIGPGADSADILIPSYTGMVCPHGAYGARPCVETIHSATTRLFNNSSGLDLMYEQGCTVSGRVNMTSINAAVSALQTFAPDYIVMVGGLGQSVESESHDRTDLRLPASQRALAQAVTKAAATMPSKPKVVMVLLNGGVVAIEEELPGMDAVLEAWYPGPLGGAAVARTLFFDTPAATATVDEPVVTLNNPGGRLPVTMYKNAYVNEINVTEMSMNQGVGRTYKYYNGNSVNFHFGHGLSYGEPLMVTAASATPKNLTVTPSTEKITISTTVKSAAGDVAEYYPKSTVMQLYLVPQMMEKNPSTGDIPLTRPPQQVVVGSKRVWLDVPMMNDGSGRDESVELNTRTGDADSVLCMVSESGTRQVFPGTYMLYGTTAHAGAIPHDDDTDTDSDVDVFLAIKITVEEGSVCAF